MEKTFYHRFGGFQDSEAISWQVSCIIDRLDEIMKSGALLSKRQLYREKASSYGCNGKDYLSICQKFPRHVYTPEFRSGFYEFVNGQFCFLLDDQMEMERPQVIPTDYLNYQTWKPYSVYLKAFPSQLHEKDLYTDVMDEWMVRDQISLNHVKGLAFPYSILQNVLPSVTLGYVCQKMKQAADQLGVPILDSGHKKFGESMEETIVYPPMRDKQCSIKNGRDFLYRKEKQDLQKVKSCY